jgi:hypothetical protein
MTSKKMKHVEWVENLANNTSTLRDERGVVQPDLLDRLSNTDRELLVDYGAYAAEELWPAQHHLPPFESIWDQVTISGRPNVKVIAVMCAHCWATLVRGLPDYATFIEQLAEGVFASLSTDEPVFPAHHVSHALSRYMDTLGPTTIGRLFARSELRLSKTRDVEEGSEASR